MDYHIDWLLNNILAGFSPINFFERFEYRWKDRAFAEQDLKTSLEGLKDYKDRKISEAAKRVFISDFEVTAICCPVE